MIPKYLSNILALSNHPIKICFWIIGNGNHPVKRKSILWFKSNSANYTIFCKCWWTTRLLLALAKGTNQAFFGALIAQMKVTTQINQQPLENSFILYTYHIITRLPLFSSRQPAMSTAKILCDIYIYIYIYILSLLHQAIELLLF